MPDGVAGFLIYMDEQKQICNKYGVEYYNSPDELKVGIAANLTAGIMYPINGLRHEPEDGTTGWFIWGGDYSEDPDFFKPLHVKHLNKFCPAVIKYLALPPGYRFQIGIDGYEDVWEDNSLLLKP